MDDIIKFSIYILFLLTSFILANLLSYQRKFSILTLRKNRFNTIDGIRGYLALSVLVHHFMLTWYWKNTGQWIRNNEIYFQNIGIIAVILFFMITGFLFTSKLLRSEGKIDWLKFYKSRILRIYPLYLFMLFLMSLIIFTTQKVDDTFDFLVILDQYKQWLYFQGVNIYTNKHTYLITAGVQWTLIYEWVFYLLLPNIAILLQINRRLLLVIVIYLLYYFTNVNQIFIFANIYFLFFLIGGIVAFLYSKTRHLEHIIKNKFFSFVALSSLVASMFYPNIYSSISITFLSLFFLIIALGNNLYGILEHRASILLGEISYSIYLLHGIVLYLLYTIFQVVDIYNLSSLEHTYYLPLIAILIVLFASTTYLFIESPAIKFSKNLDTK